MIPLELQKWTSLAMVRGPLKGYSETRFIKLPNSCTLASIFGFCDAGHIVCRSHSLPSREQTVFKKIYEVRRIHWCPISAPYA